jgi:hypothetical protein
MNLKEGVRRLSLAIIVWLYVLAIPTVGFLWYAEMQRQARLRHVIEHHYERCDWETLERDTSGQYRRKLPPPPPQLTQSGKELKESSLWAKDCNAWRMEMLISARAPERLYVQTIAIAAFPLLLNLLCRSMLWIIAGFQFKQTKAETSPGPPPRA